MTDTLNQDCTYFRYWGKHDRDASGEDGQVLHLLPYHGLDVAACSQALLKSDAVLRRLCSENLHMEESQAMSFVTFLAALHDIGKFSPGFQMCVPEAVELLRPGLRPSSVTMRHDLCGEAFLWHVLVNGLAVPRLLAVPGAGRSEVDDLRETVRPILSAVAGHHGQPAKFDPMMHTVETCFCGRSRAAAEQYLLDVATLFGVDLGMVAHQLTQAYGAQAMAVSWVLAGILVVSDWLGSDESWFPFCGEPMALDDYWTHRAVPRAQSALLAAGLGAQVPRQESGMLGTLFPWMDEPTPLQKWASEVELNRPGALYILEDTTGSGKTEAGLCLASRIIAAGLASGLYFALPTMATSNAMAGRVAPLVERFFAPWAVPTFILSHSAVAVHRLLARSSGQGDPLSKRLEAEANAWVSDSKKKALWASVGVGTIDQALLGVLPLRHQSMRLAALARSILIVDEVHSYDNYMTELLAELLRVQGALGQSVVLMSATLPASVRTKLETAYQKGLSGKYGAVGSSVPTLALTEDHPPYPSASVTPAGNHGAGKISGLPGKSRKRTVQVEPTDSPDNALAQAVEAAQAGAAVCYIRNSVADAAETYTRVRREHPDVDVLLFHSRFTLGRRLDIERSVQRRFGKGSSLEQRKLLLVATQVVEQSLDLDFDLLVSDLAPIEMLIQRMGRLHRHRRTERTQVPRMLLVSPPVGSAEPDANWFSSFLPRAAKVYPNHGQLWLSAQWLAKRAQFTSPDDARDAVEFVYGEGQELAIPQGLKALSFKADGEALGRTGLARINALNTKVGYGGESEKWSDEGETPTRLGLDSAVLRLGRFVDGQILPLLGGDAWVDWLRSQVSVPKWQVSGVAEGSWSAALEKAIRTMPDKARDVVVLPLIVSGDGVLLGQVLDEEKCEKTIQYDDEYGFRLLDDEVTK